MNLTNKEIIHKTGENIDFIQFKRLLEYQDIIAHAYTLKNPKINFGPNLTNDECYQNYQSICDELNLNVVNI